MTGLAGLASDDVRRTNLSHVLRLVHVDGPMTRAEVTAALGLNRSTVGTLVGELVEHGLVSEGPAPSTGSPGRPSPLVSVRDDTVAVLALAVKVDSVSALLVSLGGEVCARVRQERPRDRTGVEPTVTDLVDIAQQALDGLQSRQRLLGLGLAVAGLVDQRNGLVRTAPNLGWQDVPLADLVAARLGRTVPTRTLNDADAGALAERRRGAGRGVDDLVYVSGDVGVGAGVVAGGTLLVGQGGYAGEAGHVVVEADGLACRCGRTGCWETRIGEAALLRLAGEPGDGGREAVDRVLADHAAGGGSSIDAVHEVGRWMAVGLTNLVNLFDPQLVVLGDLHGRLHELVHAQLRNHLTTSLVARRSAVTVVPAALGEDAAAIGAAEALLDLLLDDPLGDLDALAATPIQQVDAHP